nr:SIR2 family protein [uncultured Undibacterium sp.]
MPNHIDPLNSLSFSMFANKGVFALLLGSGVSRASNIPTGWEITLDLVRKVAATRSEECDPNPSAWYENTFGQQPDYSDLLDTLCRSPAERQQLIRSYLEPTEEERVEGLKLPTEAHRAIADLVKAGFIRVILTTNFDKLMELALQDVGINPTVLSSPDHIKGALPLVHNACTIIKIHGDYLDTRIRNTSAELADYPKEFKQLLDRVFDEYGLVVCGWSAEWDEALRAALTRSPYRRFSMYWASRGEPGSVAKDLIARRGAQLISIEKADSFFSKLNEQISALISFSRPHPLSVDVAVASLKKYLSEPKYRIQLDDLITEEEERLLKIRSSPGFETVNGVVNTDTVTRRVRAYEASSEMLISMALVAGQWSNITQFHPWQRTLRRLAHKETTSGTIIWLDLQRYPACLIAYSLGLGAIASGNLSLLGSLLSTEMPSSRKKNEVLSVQLSPIAMFDYGTEIMKILPGKERHYLPFNSWIEDFFSCNCKGLFRSEQEFQTAFDQLEFLWMLSYAKATVAAEDGHDWVPGGNFLFRHGSYNKNFELVTSSIAALKDNSPFVKSSIFGDSVADCEKVLQRVDPLMKRQSSRFY